MISDILADAVADIDRYVKAGEYNKLFKREILVVRDAMERLQELLDSQSPIPEENDKPIRLTVKGQPLLKVLAVAILRGDDEAIGSLLDLLTEAKP